MGLFGKSDMDRAMELKKVREEVLREREVREAMHLYEKEETKKARAQHQCDLRAHIEDLLNVEPKPPTIFGLSAWVAPPGAQIGWDYGLKGSIKDIVREVLKEEAEKKKSKK